MISTCLKFSSLVFFFSSRRRHTRFSRDWSSDVCSSDLGFSRNVDAHDVPLDGAEVRRIFARMLTRAEVVGGERGRGYLRERLERLKDRWNQAKTGSVRLGYVTGQYRRQQLAGLLEPATGERWTDLTVAQSMRETENEINLLVPAGDEIYQ